ncbi:MAG: 2-oxo acid dehydrogenase subunit E2 [Planctomycetes bacterium]|nr:2-oxo acid dehydrogenase subunit E2 [Planctomycetota bacterium]
MSRQFTLPDLGEGISEAQIIRVMIKEGDLVAEDQYLMEVETDKAAVEIPSPYGGIAQKVHVEEGQTVNVGDVIVTFDGGNGNVASPKTEAAKAPAKETRAAAPVADVAPAVSPTMGEKVGVSAAPIVRKLAREMGVNLSTVHGTGPGGRVTRTDLENHGALRATGPATTSTAAAGGREPTRTRRMPTAPIPIPEGKREADKWGQVCRVPLSQIRKTIARQMSLSVRTIPHVTHCDEADITELEQTRQHLNEATGGEPKITAMTFVIRAVCLALRKFPMFNASFDEEAQAIVYKEYLSVGVAVDTERGLVVPVLRDADQLGLFDVANSLRAIAEKIRASNFGIEELRGGTFTITNVGALGGSFSTPIINYPEVAILGLGRSRSTVVVKNGEIAEALTLPLSLSFDHRATDGANAARFMREIVDYLETPAMFLLDLANTGGASA